MQALDKRRELLAAVADEVVELERLCAAFDAMLIVHDWDQCVALLADYRRVTHALANAMAASEGHRDGAFDAQLQKRAQGVMDRRDRQLEALQEVHRVSGEKLRSISNWKTYARAVGSRNTPKPSAGLNRLS